jgi:hypothetical protein
MTTACPSSRPARPHRQHAQPGRGHSVVRLVDDADVEVLGRQLSESVACGKHAGNDNLAAARGGVQGGPGGRRGL